MATPPKSLTEGHKVFCREYVGEARFCGQEAAKRAGMGTTRVSQANIASNLLKAPCVQEEIARLVGPAMKKFEVTRDRVLQETARLAFFDPRQLYDADGTLKDPSDWDDATAAAVAQIETTEFGNGYGRTKKVKTHSKTATLDMLGKYLKLWNDAAVVLPKPIGEMTEAELMGLREKLTGAG